MAQNHLVCYFKEVPIYQFLHILISTGYPILMIENRLQHIVFSLEIIWSLGHPRTKKQTAVSGSSTESEYRALALATSEVIWLKQLLSELNVTPPLKLRIWCALLALNI